MGNVLTNLFQTKIVPGLQKQFVAGSTSAWMEGNAIGVDYRGGKFITMHEMEVDGLGNYDRNLGYPRGAINGSKKQYEMKMDRGREFLIDAADNDETGFLVSGASVMAEFQASHVIPEVDCFRYAKIHEVMAAGKYASHIDATEIKASEITDTLVDDIAELQDEIGTNVPLVIVMSGIVQKYFGRDFSRSLEYMNFMSGTLHTKVRSIDGNPMMIVPSARLKTAYEFRDGVTAGQTQGGFSPTAGAKDMKWMIIPATAPIAVAKIDKPRAFSPDEYQQANAWKVDYRLFHDLWMRDEGMRATKIRTGAISEAQRGGNTLCQL